MEAALNRVHELYGIRPDWVPVVEENRGLAPWHGAALVLGDGDPYIQLRKRCLYNRSEILAHELVHAGRWDRDEPKFEEFFAYRTSRRWYRRFFGPIIQRPWEAYLAILPGFFLLVLPFALARLCLRHYQLRRCIRHLSRTRTPAEAWAAAYQMADHQIIACSRAGRTPNVDLVTPIRLSETE